MQTHVFQPSIVCIPASHAWLLICFRIRYDQIKVFVSYMQPRVRDSKNLIPYPVVGHKMLPRGGMCFDIHDSTDVDLPACLIPLSGHQGIPWGDVETNAIAKTSSWYHVPITRGCETFFSYRKLWRKLRATQRRLFSDSFWCYWQSLCCSWQNPRWLRDDESAWPRYEVVWWLWFRICTIIYCRCS